MANTKTCRMCGETKPLEGGFYCTVRRNGRRYWRSWCTQCDNRRRKRTVLEPTAPPPPLPTAEDMRRWYLDGCRIA